LGGRSSKSHASRIPTLNGIGPEKQDYQNVGILPPRPKSHIPISGLIRTWPAAAKGGRLVTRIYRWKRFITACLFLTYLGCMVIKTNACATNSPGIVQSIATKKYVAPTKDRHAENVKASLRSGTIGRPPKRPCTQEIARAS
jgi:hypothetical protein